jgi:RNA polymerase sigma-70 factor (ECF subfamily)
MTPPPFETDRALIARIEARDAEALALLYDHHAARLLGLAQRILGEGGEAEEVVQEVFLYAWRATATFDPSRGSVIAWLLVATRSRAIDRLRARRPASARGELKRL